MGLRRLALCGGFAAVLAAVPAVSSAVVVYDSGGFEPPRFVAGGELQGQDAPPAGQGPWVKDSGTSTAVVQNTNPSGGVQSVQVTRVASPTGDTRWAVEKTITPTASQNLIDIDVDMRVNQAAFGGNFGPAFGIEAYDAATTPNALKLIGSLTVDATTGDVLYQTAGDGFLQDTGTVVSRGTYHHYKLRLDFNSKTYQAFVDNVLVRTEPFVDSTAATFTDAPISTFAVTAQSEATATGSAFFDNYTLQQIPEPAGVAMLGVGLAGLMSRRRRRCVVAA